LQITPTKFKVAKPCTCRDGPKANSLEPYGYLRHIFKQLPMVQTELDLGDLLPQNIHPDDIALTAKG
jgi:hypothetical protein